jgi:hypothetical protein
LHRVFTNVRALTPALFLAPPRSAKVDLPRRVNAKIVRQTQVLSMTWYLTVRADAGYSQSTDSNRLIEFLCSIPEIKKSADTSFEAVPGQPWVSIVLARADAHGNWSSDGLLHPTTNIVALVCSDYDHAAWYDSLAIRIARFLSWSALEDHTDRQIWPID